MWNYIMPLLHRKIKDKMSWKNIFRDDNEFNEKSIIGFIAFMILCVLFFIDFVFTIGGNIYEIDDSIYDTLLWIIIGCFGISGIEKLTKK